MVYTDFTKYSHAQLRKMAQALDPGAVMAAGDPWRKAATTLKAIRQTLTKASTEAATSWEGTTSDAFHTSMLTLAASINDAAAYANDAANTLHNMSEAMAKAKRDMPEEPGNWDKVKDTVGDFFSTEDDHIQITDRKKAEAAAVMQTLAMHYRIATPALKPPPPPGGSPKAQPGRGEVDDSSSSSPSADALLAVGAMVAGYGYGSSGAGAASSAATAPQARRASAESTRQSGRTASTGAATPKDAGIKGGAAQPLPKTPPAAGFGAGTGIDGTRPVRVPPGASVATPPGTPTVPSGFGIPGSTPGGPPGTTFTSAPVVGLPGGAAKFEPDPVEGRILPRDGGAGGSRGSVPGRGVVVGSEGSRVGGAVAVPPGGAPGRRVGAVVGEKEGPIAGAGGKRAFTEGGTGLGARGRMRSEIAAGGIAGQSPMAPVMGAAASKNEKQKGKRPDYLVEDEETWASDEPSNPNVVE
ncbi:WXG100 family type VII secretion target [Kitasatospora sp. SUK 42]|uniref:WXG100 family type VII secretion target n=1 Tax=Kitasatospora sp. SUK 42 TaxID=1588882 RepID=UPI0018CB856C|nr:hypothetical protein [Kitasatospora sp. SUK 42]MBV2154167.1 hypothetical protein [Kitasatospora sp. SUK 42]